MNFYEISILITLTGSLAVVLIYLYLYSQYRQRYIGLWILSWGLHLLRICFFATPLPDLNAVLLFIYLLGTIISNYILLYATSLFAEVKLTKFWLLSAIISSFCTFIFICMNTPSSIFLLSTCLYLGATYYKNGLLYLQSLNIPGLGKKITGISFIILGIHIMDLPFFLTVSWFAPWGFLIDAVFRFVVAIGTIIVYFEKTRHDLVKSEQYYRLLAENASDVIYRYIFLPNRKFEYISPSVKNLTGYSPTKFYSSAKLVYSIVHPSDRMLLKIFIHNIHKEDFLTLRIIRDDNTLRWVEQKTVPLYNQNGICYGFEGIIRDITSRKILEQDISRLDRLNTVGEMAASVAHEIRNPMTTVRGYLQFFLSKSDFIQYKNQFELLISELDRTNSIIKEYLSLSQHRPVDFQLVRLNEIIEALYPLIKADANASNKDITLSLANVPYLYLDEKEIRQLILNLVRNSIEAMSSGGIVTIDIFQNNNEVILEIQDQGSGIPQHILENIGKPFLTTKEGGTGLGLAICYRIANRHQAKIETISTSSGTTFRIRFPIPNK